MVQIFFSITSQLTAPETDMNLVASLGHVWATVLLREDNPRSYQSPEIKCAPLDTLIYFLFIHF